MEQHIIPVGYSKMEEYGFIRLPHPPYSPGLGIWNFFSLTQIPMHPETGAMP
jgi:hypothetical protein